MQTVTAAATATTLIPAIIPVRSFASTVPIPFRANH
jgi:hypothetical protein